jgi:hypothetical protein
MQITYYDIIAFSGIHANFNAAMINVLINRFGIPSVDTVEFYSESAHGDIVSNILNNEGIQIIKKRCLLLNRRIIGGWKTLLRDFIGIIYVIKAFIKTRPKDNKVLFFGLVYPIALKFIFFISLLKKTHVFVCLHGELGVFTEDAFFRNRRYFSLMKDELKKKNAYVHYLILGKPIFNVTSHIFSKYNKPIIINHPYLFNKKYEEINTKFEPLVIGQIGTGDRGKGTQYLFEIAKKMEKDILENRVRFVLVGKLDKTLKTFDDGLVEYSDNVIEQEAFKKLIRQLHFTLQLRDSKTARAAANSSFLESLNYGKPFFSLKNSYLDYYLKEADMLNCSFNTVDEIILEIKRFLRLDGSYQNKVYFDMIVKMERIKKIFSIEYNAKLFAEQMTILENRETVPKPG